MHFPDKKFETLRDANWDELEAVKQEVSAEDYTRAHFVLGEVDRVLAVSEALQKGDYETVGQKMYETHYGLSKEYEVSCEELDYLNDLARREWRDWLTHHGRRIWRLYHQPRQR